MTQTKRRRGRPTKAEAVAAKVAADKTAKQAPPPPETVYQHVNKVRCTAISRQYPAHMGVPCNHVMSAQSTSKGGSRKHWKCAVCGATKITTAEII